MPSLVRLLIVLAALGAAAGAAIVALATLVAPTPREMSVTIPPERLNKPR